MCTPASFAAKNVLAANPRLLDIVPSEARLALSVQQAGRAPRCGTKPDRNGTLVEHARLPRSVESRAAGHAIGAPSDCSFDASESPSTHARTALSVRDRGCENRGRSASTPKYARLAVSGMAVEQTRRTANQRALPSLVTGTAPLSSPFLLQNVTHALTYSGMWTLVWPVDTQR